MTFDLVNYASSASPANANIRISFNVTAVDSGTGDNKLVFNEGLWLCVAAVYNNQEETWIGGHRFLVQGTPMVGQKKCQLFLSSIDSNETFLIIGIHRCDTNN